MNLRIHEELVLWISGCKKKKKKKNSSARSLWKHDLSIVFFKNGISSLLITRKFLVWNFWGWKIYFLSQKVDGKMIFTDYWKILVLNFSVIGNIIFLESRSWWKRWYLLVTEKFLFWTFRWWEIRFFLSQ